MRRSSATENLKCCVERNKLWEQAANESGFGDAADGEDHGAGARRNVMLAHGLHHFVKGAHDGFLQAGVHFFGVPDQALLILHPFKIADGHAAGVGENDPAGR